MNLHPLTVATLKKKTPLCVLIFALIFASFSFTQAQENHNDVLVVFDASGSMLETFGSQSRLSAAKIAVTDFLAGLPVNTRVGLRPYAHVKHSGDKAAACQETAITQTFTTTHSLVHSKAQAIQAVGSYTPTAYALTQAANDFVPGNNNTLVLLTDGKETCDGDPAAAAAALLAAGVNVKTYVIGLGVDSATRLQLQSIAQAGGGLYFDASDAASLAASFAQITQEFEKAIDKTSTDTFGKKVRGGNGFSDAVPITEGTYSLDHHQKSDEYDYFVLNLEQGQAYEISLQAAENAVTYSNGAFRPTEAEYIKGQGRLRVAHANKSEVFRLETDAPNQLKFERVRSNGSVLDYTTNDYRGLVVRQSRTNLPVVSAVYLIVGDVQWEMHKDTTFAIRKVDYLTEEERAALATAPATSNTKTTSGATPTQRENAAANFEFTPDNNVTESSAAAPLGISLRYWVILAAAIVFLIGIIILVMFLRKRGSHSAPPQQTTQPNMDSQTQGMNISAQSHMQQPSQNNYRNPNEERH